MKHVLVLKQEKPIEQTYLISGPTQLGRAVDLSWYVEDREIPPEFKKLEVFISILDDPCVSRNHAGIIPIDNSFHLVDLNSGNGTSLNNHKIHQPVQLSISDKITVGKLELLVDNIRSISQDNHALLLGHDGGNLKGVKNDLDRFAEKLEKRGFTGNITKLYNGAATKSNVLAYLDQLAYLTVPESHFLFFYSGHGSSNGLHLGNRAFFDLFGLGSKEISPHDLYPRLANVRGKKALILDCCHAGKFIDDKNSSKIPYHTLVLAGSSAAGKAYEGPNHSLADGDYMGRFTVALIKYLDQNKGILNLKDFQKELDKTFSNSPFRSFHKQKPKITGVDFTVLPSATYCK